MPARKIAERYGIPETSRLVECNANTTTQIGWIPKDNSTDKATSASLIPRLIFQSWKNNELSQKLCENVLIWSKLNPEYDYFLFDDNAVGTFIEKEYGNNIFSLYRCVNVGAAKCDIWRLMVIYIFGGIYFDFDAMPKTAFSTWEFGNRTVISGRGCNNKKYLTGCGHQWGLIYTPFHPVMRDAIKETLGNLAKRTAEHVYDISFWAFYNSWVYGPFNSSYMPGWGDYMGGRVVFCQKNVKTEMVKENGHWPESKGKKKIWKSECLK